MNSLYKITFLFFLSLLLACEDPTSTTGNNGAVSPDDYKPSTETTDNNSTTGSSTDTPATTEVVEIPEQKDCAVSDVHYDKNVFLIKEIAQQVCLVATDATKDKDLGDSHRVLRIVNTTDCSTVLEKTLPINRSADFPYYLVPNTYEKQNQILAIQGFSSTYYCSVKDQKLIGPVVPQFLKNREAVDAQSGMVKGLTVWGHYLLGRSVDYGNFAFDISAVNNPKPVLPVAEYMIPKTEEYNNLFILEAGNGTYQAFIPTTDIDAGGTMFDLDRVFQQPLKINNTVAKNVQNNRFIILNDTTDPNQAKKVAVDMFAKNRVDLPADVATKKVGDILTWLKDNTPALPGN